MSAIDPKQAEQFKILADGFGGFATVKGMDDRIQRDAGPGKVITAFALLDVVFGHGFFYCRARWVSQSLRFIR